MDLDHDTGGPLEGWDGVMQSILTVLTTRLNTRVFRREFGSEIPAMVDAPMNDAGVLALYVATAEAIDRWEPRFELTDVQIEGGPNGVLILTLSGTYHPNAHRGDFTIAANETQAIRVMQDGVQNWSLAA